MIYAWGVYIGKGEHAWQLHAIVSISNGSVRTACKGAWNQNEPHQIFSLDAAPKDDRCPACEAFWVDFKFIERGLRELRDNTHSHIGRELRDFTSEIARHNPADLAGFEWWLGPCEHGASPRTRCTEGCAPKESVST